MLTVAVVDAKVPLSVKETAWSGWFSLKMYRVPLVPGGTFVPLITTGTGPDVLMVTSGKVNGLALIGVPLTLVTLTADGPVGGASLYG